MKTIMVVVAVLALATGCDNAPEAGSALIDDGKLAAGKTVRPIDLFQGYWVSSDNQANRAEVRQRSWLELRHGDPVGTKFLSIVMDCDNPVPNTFGTSFTLVDGVGTTCFNIDQLSERILIFRENRSGISARYERS